MKNLIYAFVATLLILGAASCSKEAKTSNRPSPSQETIEMVKLELSSLKNILPVEGGVGMIITAVEYDDATNTIKYKYQYTVPVATKPSDAQKNEAKETMITIAKSSPKEKRLLDQGISFHYDYYSVYDEYLYSMDVTPEDIAE